ncbi:MAG TPA: FAD-dependent oxidoreductase [Nitrososphaeraceae archaeon]|nr:FAD-dependent oxidoreductase [Nitrososphaeraceae archaeon]
MNNYDSGNSANYNNRKQKEKYENDEFELKTSGHTESVWYEEIPQSMKFDKLKRNISPSESIDVAIVGGGIAGLLTAYMLSKSGKKVVLFEDGYICSGETGRTTAHITHTLDDKYYNLEELHGNEGARLAAESHTAAINMIELIVNEEKIDCDFEKLDGFLFLDSSDKKESLDKELEATHRAGIISTKIISKVPNLSFDSGPCLLFPNQAQFHPLKYLKGVTEAILRYGGKIFTETHIQDILPQINQVKTSDGYTAFAKNIVIATNAPIIDKVSKIYDKQQAYRTYVIGARIKKDRIPKALYWDTGNQNSENTVAPYHYVRIQHNRENNSKYDILIVGGEDHLTGNIMDDRDVQQRYTNLESWTRNRFPIEDIEFQWSGQVLEPKDGIAFIGYNPGDEEKKNIFIVTGDSGNGITHGTIAGIILTDLILGKSNPWISLYNPSRVPREKSDNSQSSNKDKKKEEENNNNKKESSSMNKDTEIKKKMISLQDLDIEQGIVQEEEKIAAYKDSNNKLHRYSAVCTHLGCTVVWNNLEKSFDCPCHGSRFSAITGKAINGPANNELDKKQ